jgi:hypothetical protein
MEINRQELPPKSAENHRQELARIIREAMAANPEILKEPTAGASYRRVEAGHLPAR